MCQFLMAAVKNVPQTGWLRHYKFIFSALETRSPWSRCQYSLFLLRGVKQNLSYVSLLASGSLRRSLACRWCSSCIFTSFLWHVCLYIQISSFYKTTGRLRLRLTLMTSSLHDHLQRLDSYFQIKPQLQGTGVWNFNIIFGDMIWLISQAFLCATNECL